MFKKQNGITLVALVITIIVLLILAGVTISMVVGQNGVLSQAKSAATNTKDAEAKEALELALSGAQGDYVGTDMSDSFFNWLTSGSDKDARANTLKTKLTENISSDFTVSEVSLEQNDSRSATVKITKNSSNYSFTVTGAGTMGVTVTKVNN